MECLLVEKRVIKTVPSDRQVMVQNTEFYAFFHFTVNTFTGTEWGHGTESPEVFNPDQMDANQWIQAVYAAGMKGAILTSQHADDPSFKKRVISSMEEDLGSRERLAQEPHLIWYPAEVDVSVRPGWFYHPEEAGKVRSLENLMDIYEKSVGGNTKKIWEQPGRRN